MDRVACFRRKAATLCRCRVSRTSGLCGMAPRTQDAVNGRLRRGYRGVALSFARNRKVNLPSEVDPCPPAILNVTRPAVTRRPSQGVVANVPSCFTCRAASGVALNSSHVRCTFSDGMLDDRSLV